MKALSIRQPYAELIISGKKKIEYRNWNTTFRGQFYVHAPEIIERDAIEIYKVHRSKLVTGAIIGKVTLYDVKHFTSDEALRIMYRYGFLLKKPQRFKKPIPFSGKQHFFEVSGAKLHRKIAKH